MANVHAQNKMLFLRARARARAREREREKERATKGKEEVKEEYV